jgi:outer membrane biosynthesis protein TonB
MAEDVPAEPVVVVVTTPGGDDSSYQVPLTTTVTFDGVVYDQVYATTNSVITFGRPDGTYWAYPATPSISLYSMDWVVFPWARPDEHLTIAASDGGFQVDISARPIWLQQATEPTNINIVAAINTDGTVSISYSLTGPTYEGQTRTGVRLTNGDVVTLEEYGVVRVEEPPVLEPEPVAPTPTPSPESTDAPVDPTPTPTPTAEPTPTPTPEPTAEPTPEPTQEPTPQPIPRPFVPEGATILSEGTSVEVVAPAGQRILSVMAWYGDPDDATRGIDVSSVITQLASGQTSVTIDSDNRYGDPAGGTVKVLIFLPIYEQIPAPEPTPEPTPTLPPAVVPEPTPTPTPEPTPTPS